jgi:PilZ domain-containing protein
MGDDDSGKRPRATTGQRSALSADEVRAFTERAPRSKVVVAVLFTPDAAGGAGDDARFAKAELVNVSSSGMFVSSSRVYEVGTPVRFQFKLDDGPVALSGSAVIARRELKGMGLKFVSLDQAAQDLVNRLVEAASGAPEPPPGEVEYGHGTVKVRLSPATARYFTYNPLLHIGVGGCFLPSEREVALGTGFEVSVVDGSDRLLLRASAKVAATQEGRLGLRFIDPDRTALHALRAEIARVAPVR